MVVVELSACAWLELVVMAFQMIGVAGLCLSRLLTSTRWGDYGRIVLIVALVGLGISGACCGHLDSEFGLFAGGTMTVLLVGMILGSGAGESHSAIGRPIAPEANLAG